MTDFKKKSALIIEDFAEFARSLRSMLLTIGLEKVDMAINGEVGVHKCVENQYDIVISDYNLGEGKNGMQVLEELNHSGRLKSEAVFMMSTAENTTAMVMGAIENEPDAYLTKPYNLPLLQTRLTKLVIKKESLTPIYRAMDKKQYKAALKHCEELLERFPKYKMAILKLKSKCLLKKRQYDAAISIFDGILSTRPIPWAMVGLAHAFRAKRDYESAALKLKETIAKFPMVLEAYDLLADCQHKLGEFEECQKTLENAVKKSPRVITRQNKLGQVAQDNGDFDTSIGSFKNAIKFGRHSVFHSPDSYMNFVNSASKKIALDEGKADRRLLAEVDNYLKEFNKSYRSDPVCRMRGALAQGSLLLSQGKKDDANKFIERAKTTYEELETMMCASAGLEAAKAFKMMGENDIGEQILKETIEQNFEDTEFLEKALPFLEDKSVIENGKLAHKLNAIGIKHFDQNQFDKAVESFKDAIAASPQNVTIILNTVQVLLKVFHSGNAQSSIIDDCLRYLNSIINLSPEDPRFHRFSELMRLTRAAQQGQ